MSNGVYMENAVIDAGPLIHLQEVKYLKLLGTLKKLLTTPEIMQECRRIEHILSKIKNLLEVGLSGESKDFAQLVMERYGLDLGEATGLALCKQARIKHFLTDDLEARDVSKALGFEPHGTLAIILRCYREKDINKNEVIRIIENLYSSSSMFLSKNLRDWTIREVNNFTA
jgi:predicted nucleic acid-binding protein